MRDRVTDLLPLLLVGVVLLVFQVVRDPPAAMPFIEPPGPTPTPVVAVAGANAHGTPRPRQTPEAPALGLDSCYSIQPIFVGGMRALRQRLGASMGEAVECEHAVGADGDTQQRTTTGLAYYRKALNMAGFTNGWEHWALLDRGLVHWSGMAVDPPLDASILPH
jgi:hypothetical protein